MPVPQIILTLAPSGSLVAELPGPAGRRQVALSDDPAKAIEVIRRVLQAQARAADDERVRRIGHDSAPTQAQVIHWQRHCARDQGTVWSDPMCVFCIEEGRFDREPEVRERARKRVERNQRRTIAQLGSGADTVEVRRAQSYRSRFVLVRDEDQASPIIMLREEAKALGLRPIEAEQRSSASAEELGL